MRLAIVSDTHGLHDCLQVPDADVFVHCGDFLTGGSQRLLWKSLGLFGRWLDTLPHKHKLIVPGNHDWLYQTEYAAACMPLGDAVVLHDAAIEIGGYKIYGTAWQPVFYNWAFNVSDARRAELFARIPDDTDILLTHVPPRGTLDFVEGEGPQGDAVLRDRILQANLRDSLKLHAFGHIHECGGQTLKVDHQHGSTLFVNACGLDEGCEVSVVELD